MLHPDIQQFLALERQQELLATAARARRRSRPARGAGRASTIRVRRGWPRLLRPRAVT